MTTPPNIYIEVPITYEELNNALIKLGFQLSVEDKNHRFTNDDFKSMVLLPNRSADAMKGLAEHHGLIIRDRRLPKSAWNCHPLCAVVDRHPRAQRCSSKSRVQQWLIGIKLRVLGILGVKLGDSRYYEECQHKNTCEASFHITVPKIYNLSPTLALN